MNAKRCAALAYFDGTERCRVLFRRDDGSQFGLDMSLETYRAFPLGVDVSPEDFAKIGAVSPAPDNFEDMYGVSDLYDAAWKALPGFPHNFDAPGSAAQ